MGKEIAIITLHGMGDYKPNYYEELKSKLVKALDTDWQKVAFEP